ncbi:hypothetical protein BZG36_03186 [Bifiguratus adelaidae]|uniref:Nicotinate phosphoribosyltransferase n=1 Tax=Bifiguratus adelaidae TaxID=1938954 RepID=A0A261XYM6_9FUNG|nr:hypothetical protein BZG36_03186 [Bifiguratus adelaidae]
MEEQTRSWSALYNTLVDDQATCSHESLLRLLKSKTPQFTKGLDAFPRRSTTTVPIKEGDWIVYQDNRYAIHANEVDLLNKLSAITQLDTTECVGLWKGFVRDTLKQDTAKEVDNADAYLPSLILLHYDERLSFLKTLATLFRAGDDQNSLHHKAILPTQDALLGDDDGDAFINTIFSQYCKLLQSEIPKVIEFSDELTDLWARQCAREQIALLQILFLVFYDDIRCTPTWTRRIFDEFKRTDFGQRQRLQDIIDDETSDLLSQSTQLAILISIEILDLDTEAGSDMKTDVADKHSIDESRTTNQLVLSMDKTRESALLLLAWAFYLEKLSCGKSNGEDQTLITEALRLGAISKLAEILNGPNMDELINIDAIGYRSVIKSLVSSFLIRIRISYVQSSIYQQFVSCFALLYEGQPDLTDEFWIRDISDIDRSSLLAVARARFPTQFRPFVRLLASLTGTPKFRSGSRMSARMVAQQFAVIPRVTLVEQQGMEYEVDTHTISSFASPKVICTKTIAVSDVQPSSVIIPAGTTGHIVSAPGEPKVIQWDMSFSGWFLLVDLLRAFVSRPPGSIYHGDSKFVQDSLAGDDVAVVEDALHLLKATLQADREVSHTLIQHLESLEIGPTTKNDMMALLLEVMEHAAALHSVAENVFSLALECFRAFLPLHEYEAFAYLRKSLLLPSEALGRSSNAPSQVEYIIKRIEAVSGSYSVTFAFLDLLEDLIKIGKQSVNAQSTEVLSGAQVQVEVISTCLNFVESDMLPNYATWRYNDIADRFRIGTKIASILSSVLSPFPSLPGSINSGGHLHTIHNALIDKYILQANSHGLFAIINIISNTKAIIDSLALHDRIREAQLAEQSLIASLEFLRQLLSTEQEIGQGTVTQLHKTLLQTIIGRDNRYFVNIILHGILYGGDVYVPRLCIAIVTLLVQLSAKDESIKGSFVGYFGVEEESSQLIDNILSQLQDRYQSESLKVDIWRLLSTIIDTQPGLASMFLNYKRDGEKRLLSTIIMEALEHSTEPETLRTAASVLQLCCSLWQSALFHYEAFDGLRNEHKFWSLATLWLLEADSPTTSTTPPPAQVSLSKSQDNVKPKNAVVIQCSRHFAMSFALRLLSLEVKQAWNVTEPAEGDVNTKVTSTLAKGAQDVFKQVREQRKLPVWRSISLRTDLDDSVRLTIQSIATENDIDPTHLSKGSIRSIALRITGWERGHNSQITLLRELSAFIQIASALVPDMLWQGPKDSVITLTDFLKMLTSEAARGSGRSLNVHYEICNLISSLFETRRKMFKASGDAGQSITLLGLLVAAFENSLFPIQDSVHKRVFPLYHVPLFNAALLCLRSISLSSANKADQNSFNGFATRLLYMTCTSFQDLFLQDAAPQGDTQDYVQEVVTVLTVMAELIDEKGMSPEIWLPLLTREHTFKLLIDGSSYALRKAHDGPAEVAQSWRVCAASVLQVVLAASSHVGAARLLIDEGIFDAFSLNEVSLRAQNGDIQPFTIEETAPRMRNPWHALWCLELGIVDSLLATIGNDDNCLKSIVGFVNLHGPQFDVALSISVDAYQPKTKSREAASPSLARLNEVDKMSRIFCHLANQKDRAAIYAREVLLAFKDKILPLLQHYLYFFNHPSHLANFLGSVNRLEDDPISVNGEDLSKLLEQGSDALVNMTRTAMMSIVRNILAGLVPLLQVQTILKKRPVDWPYGNTIFASNLKTSVDDPASIGTLLDLIAYAVTQQRQDTFPKQVLTQVIESSLLIAATQYLLYLNMSARLERQPLLERFGLGGQQVSMSVSPANILRGVKKSGDANITAGYALSAVLWYVPAVYLRTSDGQVYTKPYNYWTPGDQKLVTPTDYSLCVGMSLQTGTLFLLQMFWNYLASSVAKASFMGSWEFRMYIAWVCGSFAMYPLLQWNFSRSIYPFEYREIVPQLAYGISMLIVACSNIVTMFRFRKLMATAAQNVHGKKVMQKLAYFHDLNKVLTVSIILFGAGFLVLCIDGLTQAQFLNTHKFTADLCICIINLSSAVLWVVCILVVHPSESFAAHHSENDYYSHSHVHSQSNAPPPRMPSQPVGIVVEESVDYIPYKKQPTSPTSPLEYIRLPEKNNREYDGMRTPDERSVTKTNYDEFSDYGAPSPRPLHREDGVDFYPVQLPSPPPAVRPKSPLRARQQEIPMQAMVFKNTDSDAEPYDEEFSRRQRAHNDLYKFSMQQAVLQHFPEAVVTYRYKTRTEDMKLNQAAIDWLETRIRALISEAYFTFVDKDWDYEGQDVIITEKVERLLRHGCKFSEFGTRRRRDYRTQDIVLANCVKTHETYKKQHQDGKGALTGTSNVHFAMKYNIRAIGTVAHEFFMGISAIDGLPRANRNALTRWHETFQGNLGIALTDTFSTQIFFADFDKQLAELYDGVRQDSGDPFTFVDNMVAHFKKLGIDPNTKTVIFSDSLDVPKAEKLHDYCQKAGIQCGFGIGTHLTNDFWKKSALAQGKHEKSKPLNIVIKMKECEGKFVVKLSDDLSKNSGEDEVVRRVKDELGL